MKAALYSLLLFSLLTGCDKYTEKLSEPISCNFINFYYFQDTTISLGELSNQYIIVAFDSNATESQIRNFVAADKEFDSSYQPKLYPYKIKPLKFSQPKTCEEITATIARIQKNPMVVFAHYTMQTDDCLSPIGYSMGNLCVNSYSNYFYVKVKDQNDLTDLKKLIKETNTVFIEQYTYDLKWCTLQTTKNSKGDAMKMANYFRDSKLFLHAQPEPWKFSVE